jgi:hypothetical protein
MDLIAGNLAQSKANEDRTEESVEGFLRLSGQGDSAGWIFDRDDIHQRK